MHTAKMTSKGQVTIPSFIRELLKLEKGSIVMFRLTERAVVLSPCEIQERLPYTADEWEKIEQLVAEKGKVYRTAAAARKYLKSL